MAVTITPFNHTLARLLNGDSVVSGNWKVNLYTAFVFDATATTKAAAETSATQVATANGYTQNTLLLTGKTVTTVLTNGATLDANNAVWNASGGDITAQFAMVYDDDDADDAPLFFINFDSSRTANDGTPFQIAWNVNGILRVSVP